MKDVRSYITQCHVVCVMCAAIIRVESATNGTVRLRSQSSRVFLCFNKMGSIVIRVKYYRHSQPASVVNTK